MSVSYTHLDVYKRQQLSLIIGKNNTGKTSFLTAMDSFFNYYVGAFSYDDFSFQLREKVEKISPRISPDKYPEPCISMKIYISYDDMDDLSNIGAVSYTHLDVYKRQQ